MANFSIVRDNSSYVRRFSLKGRNVVFKIKPVPENENPVHWIKDAVRQIILYSVQDLQSTDKVGFTFSCDDFTNGPGWFGFRNASDVKFSDIWAVLGGIFQSNSCGLNTNTFCLNVTSVSLPSGTGNRPKKYASYAEECLMRRGIITINNKDNNCLPRAIVVSMAYVDKSLDYNKIRRDNGKIQTQKALQLLNDADITIPEQGAGISELQQFQRFLNEYQITVYAYGSKGRDIIYKGAEATKRINLLHYKNHYNVITSLTAAFSCNFFCEHCHIPYEHKVDHRCQTSCFCCHQSPACNRKKYVTCNDCNRKFKGINCFENHKKAMSDTQSLCERLKQCTLCLKLYKNDRNHICNEIFCKICYKFVEEDHLCFMPVDTKSPSLKDILFIFYDLETQLEQTSNVEISNIHKPNLCIFVQRCDSCMDNNADLVCCEKCGVRLQKLSSTQCIESFMHHILSIRKKFRKVVVIAHNGQSFDHQFLLRYVLEETVLKPKLIMRGTKIILLEISNVRFIDSINYFPMALSKLPKAFDLPSIFKKGYFPYLFNTVNNQNYIGSRPGIEYYDSDSMYEPDRLEFLQWYEKQKHNTFNMKEELESYCTNDVLILMMACLKFRKMFLEECKVCPFTEACTIASACNKVYRRNFLKPNTIGIIPRGGYRLRDNQSEVAFQWLIFEEKKRNINIKHAAKQKEVKLNGIRVDGYCEETNQIFQMHGCWYHGCVTCFPANRDKPLYNNSIETFNSRYESTLTTTNRLQNFGFEVIEMWECVFKNQVHNNKEMKHCLDSDSVLWSSPLNPRDSFYGGRTGNTVMYYKAKTGEKIRYLDICSLYPYICKTGKFPIGHPEVLIGEDCQNVNLLEIDGLIKCKILPPQSLYHPVLPIKMNNKLMFVLCRTCGEQMNPGDCSHSDNERSLISTWVVQEVVKAIEKGYKVQEIYEIWKYEVQQYDKENQVNGLFTEMMNKFIQVKQEASGWPLLCTTKDQKQQYLEQFSQSENIELVPQKIVNNPGLRSLAKLILNSFWGKLGQRENQQKVAVVHQPDELYQFLVNPAVIVSNILPINDSVLVVSYEFKEECYDILPTVNVCLAAFVTTQARLKLYNYLEQLGDRVLYYDTDSVIYVSKENEYEPPIGNCVGDMTDELVCYGENSYIQEFVSGGPKNYSFRVYTPNDDKESVVCKVKGIKLNYHASQQVNFSSIKNAVLNDSDDNAIIISSNQIRRTHDHQVLTKKESKIYRINSVKRKFLENHSSVPYGFKFLKRAE